MWLGVAMAKKDGKIERLAKVDLFRKCTDKELRKIAAIADEVKIEQGHVLCEQDHVARECFVILDGEAAVDVEGEQIAVVGPGQSLGEMALLNRKPRMATATARTPMTVYAIHAQQFRGLLEEAPIVALTLLENLSERLRDVERDPEGRPVHH